MTDNLMNLNKGWPEIAACKTLIVRDFDTCKAYHMDSKKGLMLGKKPADCTLKELMQKPFQMVQVFEDFTKAVIFV